MHSAPVTKTPGSDRRLCKVGGVAALSAGILFRRNLGVEVEAFIESIPDVDWIWPIASPSPWCRG
jgi:hypothetical protein